MPKNKKIAFITGSSRGLGYEIAKKLLKENFVVIINSNNIKSLQKSLNYSKDFHYICGDIKTKQGNRKIFEQIKIKYKKLDLLICNYGNSDYKKNNLDLEHAITNNLYTAHNSIQNSIKLLKQHTSKIICISSICGIEYIEGAPYGYSIAKSALNTMVKLYSNLFAEKGISVNAIVPGNMDFEGSLWRKKIRKNRAKTKNYIKKNVPINKFGTIDDIFSLIKAIIYNKSQFLTGSILISDGGQTKKF